MKTISGLFTKRKDILLPIVFLTIFLTGVLIKAPLKQAFEYNPDEGTFTMQTLLFLKGFSLYKEIWSDQPPLFTVILAYWLKLFGTSVYYGRILVLIFSGILLFAFYQTVRIQWGHLCAFGAVVFLTLSTAFLRLSISVMPGIPSLALAMFSIYCITLYKKLHLKYLLVLSGIFMALSLQTKLITAFLIPIIVLEIIQAEATNLKGRQNQPFLSVFFWCSSLLAIYLVITIMFLHLNLPLFIQQLIQPHLRKLIIPKNNFLIIWKMMITDYDIALLTLTGIVPLIRQKKWRFLFPVLWLALAFAILLIHRPVWHHYYLLVSIPLCWLAAISFSELFQDNIRRGWFTRESFFCWLTAGLIILAVFRLPVKYNRMLRSVKGDTSPQERAVVELLSKYKKDTHWIVTDRPIFALYASILVPPELAVTAYKRRFIDSMAQEYFINKLQKYRPELILLNRFNYYGPEVITYIERNYANIYQDQIPKRGWSIYNMWIDLDMEFVNIKRFFKPLWALSHRRHYNTLGLIQNTPPQYKTYITNIKLYIRKDIMER